MAAKKQKLGKLSKPRVEKRKVEKDVFQLWAQNANQQMRNIFKDEREGKINTPEQKYKLQRAREAQLFLINRGYTTSRKGQTQVNFKESANSLSSEEIRQIHIFLGNITDYEDIYQKQADDKRMSTFLKNHPGWTEKDYWTMRAIANREGFKNESKNYSSDKVIELMNSINAEDYEEFIKVSIRKKAARTTEEQDFIDKLFGSTEIKDDPKKLEEDIKKKAKDQIELSILLR